jgi:hypothetical protein
MADVPAKGANFLYAKRFIEASYGTEKWEKVMHAMSKGVIGAGKDFAGDEA